MMYNKNSDHKGLAAPPMSPRISFSNDFVESSSSHSHSHHQNKAACIDAPPLSSSDFEFSVSNYSMTTADELFSKGKLLPLKVKTTTLRDELQNDDDDDDDIDDLSSKPPKNPTRLRGFLGLRKPHVVSRKSVKAEGSVKSCSKNSQDSVGE